MIEAAAGARRGIANALLFVPEREPKNAQIVASPDGLDHIPGTLHRVAQSPIDALAADQRRIDFIKIDAEGAEEAVIAGTLATLRRDRPLLVLEFNAARARDPGALLATLGGIYGAPRYLDLHGNVLETTPERLLRERFATDWLLVFGSRLISAASRSAGPVRAGSARDSAACVSGVRRRRGRTGVARARIARRASTAGSTGAGSQCRRS